jgi:hypothetical protein
MSLTRRLKREQLRNTNKNKRTFDTFKILKTLKMIFLVSSTAFIITFLITFYLVYSNNSIRKSVNENPNNIVGTVVSISTGKGAHKATYEFNTNNIKYTGSTFGTYKGVVGEHLCVKFNQLNPKINIYCYDMEMESWTNDSLLLSLKIGGFSIGFTFILLIWKLIIGDKKIIAELTSRNKNYR